MPEFNDLVPVTEVSAELRERHGVTDADYQRVWRSIRAGIVPCERIGAVLFLRRGDLPALAKALIERPRRRSTAEPTPLPRPKPRPRPAGPSLPPAA